MDRTSCWGECVLVVSPCCKAALVQESGISRYAGEMVALQLLSWLQCASAASKALHSNCPVCAWLPSRYWDDDDATAAAQLPGGWLRTGDLGCLSQGEHGSEQPVFF